MGITGAWAQKASADYTGATRWGTGVNPIHGVRDNGRGRVIGAKGTLYPLGEPSDAVNASIQARDIDFVVEDYVEAQIEGERYRYSDADHPRWDVLPPQFRGDVYGPAMGEWTPWGVYNDTNPVDGFPLGGPTGGMGPELDISHGENVERQHMIAVPTPAASGGWFGKNRGAVATPETQDAAMGEGLVWTLNNTTYQGPGVKSSNNERAVARGTDSPRTPVQSRTAGMMAKVFGRSFGMGGGTGTPDMFPYQQTAGLKRPFLTRAAALPPDEPHYMNDMEARSPFQRAVPADPYQGDPEVGAGGDGAQDWGY